MSRRKRRKFTDEFAYRFDHRWPQGEIFGLFLECTANAQLSSCNRRVA